MNTCCCCTEEEELYIFPCRHIICKNCLISEGKGYFKCRKCGCKFKKENVIEYIEEEEYSDEDEIYNE